MIDAIRDALADSWNRGVSPIGRLEAAIDQADAVERAAIEQGAARLSVRLLLPTGLCFLPAFLFLAIILPHMALAQRPRRTAQRITQTSAHDIPNRPQRLGHRRPLPHRHLQHRQHRGQCRNAGSSLHATFRPHDLGAMLAALHAHVRAGASLAQARARVMGEDRIGAVDPYGPNAADIATMVRRCAGKDERASHVRTVADELAMACRLSASLGCGAARCCAAVSASYRRLRTLDDLRSNAFAMPKATVRLLSVLPFATVALGYVLGARPVEFLIGSTSGLVCLGLGMGVYALGMAWIRRLMNHCSDIRDLVNVDPAGRRRR